MANSCRTCPTASRRERPSHTESAPSPWGEAGLALVRLRRKAVLERPRLGEVELATGGYVFSERPEGSTPCRPDKVTGFFSRVRDELGQTHVHLHSPRHFMATQLAARGGLTGVARRCLRAGGSTSAERRMVAFGGLSISVGLSTSVGCLPRA
jgi:hypothetical protein